MLREKTYLILGIVTLVLGLAAIPLQSRRPSPKPATAQPEVLEEIPLALTAANPPPHGTQSADPEQGETPAQGKFSKFERLASDTLERLPRLEDLAAKSTSELHFAPPELFASSPSLGAIATSLREHPEFIPQGIRFYDDCARKSEVLSAVRILCLRNLQYWTRLQPDVMNLDRGDYPEEIWDIARSLPPVRP